MNKAVPGLPMESVSPHDIVVSGRARAELDEAALTRLMESISKIGMQTPPTIRWVGDDPILVAGRHRLEAAKRLGWEVIRCIVLDASDAQCRMWEISENLHRADLTALERSEHVAEWISLTNISAQVEPKLGRPESGINAAARELGIDRNDAQRSVKVAALSPEAKGAAIAAGLDNNRGLLVAASKEKDAAAQVRVLTERAVKPAPAIKNAFESEEDWRRALFNVWNRGAADWRERAMETLDTPVFDRTRAA